MSAIAPLVGEERALELLEAAVAAAPADELEVCLRSRHCSVLRFAADRVHQPQDLASLQLMVRAVVGGRAARAATSSPALYAETVRRAATEAAALGPVARAQAPAVPPPVAAGAPDEHPGLGEPSRLLAGSTLGWTPREAAARLSQVLASTAVTGRPELIGALAAGTSELAVASSLGLRRYAAATEASFSCTAEHAEGTSHAEALTRDAALVDVGAIAAALCEEASAMRGAVELEPGTYDVVFGPLATGELIGFLPAFGFNAPALAAGVGVVARGERRFGPLVDVVDDATTGPGLPFPFDCEGTTKRRVELIRAGEPVGVVSDRASGALTGGSTGHAHVGREEVPEPRAANLRLEPKGSSLGELLAGLESGVYVQRLWYTRVVDASRGVITGTTRDAAFLIRGGRLAAPVRGIRLTESVLDALARVDAVSDELQCQPVLNVWNGCVAAPAIRVRGFRLGEPSVARGGGAAGAAGAREPGAVE